MEIRLMREEDAKSASIIVEKNYNKKEGEQSLSEILEMFGTSIIGKPCYYVAEEDERIVGFAGFTQAWMDYDTYEIFWVNVDPEYQGKGIGTKIVGRLLEEIRKQKTAKLVLLATSSPLFYEKQFNFKRLYSFGEDPTHLMMLPLG